MFGKSARIIRDLEYKVVVLESNLAATERSRDSARSHSKTLARTLRRRDAEIEVLRHEMKTCCPHQHNFADLELRVLAAVADSHSPFGATGRWSASSPALQNIPRPRPAPVLNSVSFEYRGKRATFPLSNSTIKLELVEVNEGRTLRVIVHKPDNSTVHYDYIAADITSEIRKEWH